MDRLTNLTAEQRAQEKEDALRALKAEVPRRKEMADEQFDVKTWYQTEAAKINTKYAGL
jgi:hypothetical protein